MSDKDDELFGEGDKPAASDTDNANQNQEPSPDPFADQLSGIKNEDGTQKYADVASALDALPHANTHISTIEAENAKLKEDLAREQAAKELLQNAANKQEPAQQNGLTAEDVKALVVDANAEQAAANQQEANVNSVRSAFSAQYGDKAGEEMNRVAAESGMTKEALKNLSKSSPQAVLQLAGIKVEAAPVQRTPYRAGNDQPSPQPAPAKPKSVMSGANTKEMVDAWKGAGERIKQT